MVSSGIYGGLYEWNDEWMRSRNGISKMVPCGSAWVAHLRDVANSHSTSVSGRSARQNDSSWQIANFWGSPHAESEAYLIGRIITVNSLIDSPSLVPSFTHDQAHTRSRGLPAVVVMIYGFYAITARRPSTTIPTTGTGAGGSSTSRKYLASIAADNRSETV